MIDFFKCTLKANQFVRNSSKPQTLNEISEALFYIKIKRTKSKLLARKGDLIAKN